MEHPPVLCIGSRRPRRHISITSPSSKRCSLPSSEPSDSSSFTDVVFGRTVASRGPDRSHRTTMGRFASRPYHRADSTWASDQPRGCPSAVTARVTAKRCSLDALTLAERLLDAASSPCHGAPRTRGCRGGTHTTSSPGLHRASRVSATLRWSRRTNGCRKDKDSLPAPHVYLARTVRWLPPGWIPTDELRDAIALLFKRKGRDELSEREFVLSASMDMHWFPPRDAQRLRQLGLETKLLESQGGAIRPAFDGSAVEVPRDYIPTSAILDISTAVSEDVFLRIVDAIVAKTKTDRKSVIASVNAVQEKLDVEVEVAALVAAHQSGVDVTSFLPAVKSRLGMP